MSRPSRPEEDHSLNREREAIGEVRDITNFREADPEAPDEVPHPSGCGCVGCYYEELRTAAEPPGGTPGHGEKKVA